LKDGNEAALANAQGTGGSGVVDINTLSAILFVVVASFFLILLYKLMSFWFVELLVVLFCIGGVEVCMSLLFFSFISLFP
jgi:signal peptide peptidase-like 2B